MGESNRKLTERMQMSERPDLNKKLDGETFRTISGNPRQFNYQDESAGLCISAQYK